MVGKQKGVLSKDSWNSWLLTFERGERRYLEIDDVSNYASMMRTVNTPKSRRPNSMNGMEFSAQCFTAVPTGKFGEVRYLMCVERIE